MIMIQTAITISFASLGFRCITGKGMIFYFMREWLDKLSDRKKDITRVIQKAEEEKKTLEKCIESNLKEYGDDHLNTSMYKEHIRRIFGCRTVIALTESPTKYDCILYLFKPIILCSTCMASVHTLIWYPILVGSYSIETILVMLIVAFLNTFFYGVIELIQKSLT